MQKLNNDAGLRSSLGADIQSLELVQITNLRKQVRHRPFDSTRIHMHSSALRTPALPCTYHMHVSTTCCSMPISPTFALHSCAAALHTRTAAPLAHRWLLASTTS